MADLAPEVATPVASVSTDTPAPDAPPEAQASEGPVEAKAPEVAPPEKTYSQKEHEEALQKRLAKESRRIERIAVERARRELAEAEVVRLRAERAPQQAPTQSVQGEPKPEQFQDYESYLRAQVRWEIQQSQKEADTKEQAERQKREAFEQSSTLRAKLVEPGAAKYDDFEEVVFADDVTISGAMVTAIMESDIPSDLAYFLGTHRDEAKRIAALKTSKQYLEVDKIIQTLTKPPEQTKAPPPITPASGKGAAIKDPSDMPYEDYVKWLRKERAKL